MIRARAQDLPNFRDRGAGKVALDIGIVCPQAASHVVDAAVEISGAAEAYIQGLADIWINRSSRNRVTIYDIVIAGTTPS